LPISGVVAQADTGAEAQVLEAGKGVGGDVAAIDEGDRPELLVDPHARLDRGFHQVAAAGDGAVRSLDAEAAVAVTAHGAPTTGEEEPVGRDVGEVGTEH